MEQFDKKTKRKESKKEMEQFDKRAKRKESKKKKAIAFLELAKHDISKKMKCTGDVSLNENIQDEEAEPPKKKYKQDDPSLTGNDQIDVDLQQVLKDSTKTMEEDLEKLRKAIRERQKSSMEKPKLYLTLDDLASQHGLLISQDVNKKELPPLFMLDLQHLLLLAIQGNVASYKPRWCRLLRCSKVSSVVVLEIDSVSSTEYKNYTDCFTRLKSNFEMSVDMVCPSLYKSSVAEDLFNVPVSHNQMKKLQVPEFKKARIVIPKTPNPDLDDKFPRTCLLLNTAQMIQEGYPMPMDFSGNDTYENFTFISEEFKTVTSHSPLFALDCEMCLTVVGKQELTRVSVVNEKLETVYDTFVKPYNKIKDYLTRWSGITKYILDPITTRLEDVQRELKRILPSDAILCGQSLNGDLMALKMYHPYVIDTSVIYNLSGNRSIKTGLKKLTSHFLGQDIQDSASGHCSIEDAKATMELVLLKLNNCLEFGDVVMGGVLFPKIIELSDPSKSSVQSVTGESNVNKTVQNCVHNNTDGSDLYSSQYITKTCNAEENRRRAFFQRSGEFVYQNFFKLTRQSCKTAALIASKDIMNSFKDQDIVAIETDGDKTSKSLTSSYVQFHDFIYASFPSFGQLMSDNTSKDEDIVKKCLKKLDKKISKVIQNLKPGTLLAVVLSGRGDDKNNCAKTFVKII